MPGLAGRELPARAPPVSEIGEHPVDGAPDPPERLSRQVAVLRDRLARPTCLHEPVEDPPEDGVRGAEGMGELDSVHAPPAPGAGVAAEALFEPVECGLERLERNVVPRPALRALGRGEPGRVAFVPE